MNLQTPVTAEQQDGAQFDRIRKPRHQDMLVFAARKSGRSVMQIQRDFSRLSRQDGRINMVEYLLHGLYEEDRYSDAQRAEFIGNDIHWPITHTCNNPGWQQAAEDKALAATLLRAGDVPVPDCLAVIDRSPRIYPGMQKITSAEDLRDFCLQNVQGGLFGKILGGMVGFGVFRIENADDTHLFCSNHEPMTYADFLQNLVADNKYLIQRQLRNHSKIADYASALATIRMVNLVTPDRVFTPVAAMAMAQGNNIADAFWRDENIACGIDLETGKIETVAKRNEMVIEYLADHPEKPGLKGLELPHWQELRDINERAAKLFAPIRYQSADIAITETGPVIVEINYGCGFGLPQQASGQGMLTPEVKAFFQECGYDFTSKGGKKRSFFRRR
ncbi:sugar-transfer associated ATP-grasp domain-containing protein [Roseovarius sp. CAU 1744]|uniref:sugar-transfer associated ATP-grasp domain-containing protein n=1 Tax=Roseovarius sp. CAU 1744 TaxID=3140368 RepID=UPI00325A7D2A